MKFLLTLITALILPLSANAAAVIGEPAPDFTATDILSGEDISLTDLKGKTV
ncbi:MAG: thioredoxin family protein, partial [Alphaproteobacteria bacterium]|nr:thioredoxin family protein [Alphaproteobacteria bacterium]